MKTFYVRDLQQHQVFSGETFVVKEINSYTDKNGKPYYDVTLADKTGDIRGKIWSDSLAMVYLKAAKKGSVVAIDARVEMYKTTPQLAIMALRGVDETQLDEYLESSTYPVEQMWAELEAIVEGIKDPGIKKLLQNIVNDPELGRKLRYWPAGMSIHHSFRSGLLQHILEMQSVVGGLDKYFPNANYDVVRAGIILHDIGKLKELQAGGLVTDYERTGNLLGHIVLGVQMVDQFAPPELTNHCKVHLQHIILSHHGEREKGSPVIPATVEAVMVQMADELSAKARKISDALIKDSDNGMTAYDYREQTRYWDGGDNLVTE